MWPFALVTGIQSEEDGKAWQYFCVEAAGKHFDGEAGGPCDAFRHGLGSRIVGVVVHHDHPKFDGSGIGNRLGDSLYR